jgi:hypothetical protein
MAPAPSQAPPGQQVMYVQGAPQQNYAYANNGSPPMMVMQAGQAAPPLPGYGYAVAGGYPSPVSPQQMMVMSKPPMMVQQQPQLMMMQQQPQPMMMQQQPMMMQQQPMMLQQQPQPIMIQQQPQPIMLQQQEPIMMQQQQAAPAFVQPLPNTTGAAQADVTYHLYRENTGVRVSGDDKVNAVYFIGKVLDTSGNISYRMHQGPATGPIFYEIRQQQHQWHFFSPNNPNPVCILKFPNDQYNPDRRVFLGPDGMWYEWFNKGSTMECCQLPSRNIVAIYNQPSLSFNKEGSIHIKRQGQHMQYLLVATGYVTDRIVTEK